MPVQLTWGLRDVLGRCLEAPCDLADHADDAGDTLLKLIFREVVDFNEGH